MKQRKNGQEYLLSPTGLLNLAEIICLIIALICVALTSRFFAEFADNLQWIYPDLSTLTVRGVFQSFTLICLIITIVIFIGHIFAYRYYRKHFLLLNQISLVTNIVMGLMMISIGICAALWEDKLRRTPLVIKRGYFSNEYQTIFHEQTHPRAGAAAAAAAFALLAGILFIIEACTRPMLAASFKRLPPEPVRPIYTVVTPTTKGADRIIPVESIARV